MSGDKRKMTHHRIYISLLEIKNDLDYVEAFDPELGTYMALLAEDIGRILHTLVENSHKLHGRINQSTEKE